MLSELSKALTSQWDISLQWPSKVRITSGKLLSTFCYPNCRVVMFHYWPFTFKIFENYNLINMDKVTSLFILSTLSRLAKIVLVEELFQLQRNLNTIISDLPVPSFLCPTSTWSQQQCNGLQGSFQSNYNCSTGSCHLWHHLPDTV